jgi:hypothetical protein
VPQDDGSVLFLFERGHPVYKELVSNPGLSAIGVVDRATGRLVSVKFRHRPSG